MPTPLGNTLDTVFGTVVRRSYTLPVSTPAHGGIAAYRSYSIAGPWSANSPLPPNFRYVEMPDWKWYWSTNDLEGLAGIPDATIMLPRNHDGLVMHNLKALPDIPFGASSFEGTLAAAYNDDSYWTGTVTDPVNWVDEWWDSQGIGRDMIKEFLDVHPGCRLYS